MSALKVEVEKEMEDMTPEKGRELLRESSVMIFLGLDLNSTLVFDSFLHSNNTKHKLSSEGVAEVYTGTKYNPDENSLMIWALYPPNKKLAIIDTEKAFDDVVTLKARETDLVVIVELGVNVAKLNKAQI